MVAIADDGNCADDVVLLRLDFLRDESTSALEDEDAVALRFLPPDSLNWELTRSEKLLLTLCDTERLASVVDLAAVAAMLMSLLADAHDFFVAAGLAEYKHAAIRLASMSKPYSGEGDLRAIVLSIHDEIAIMNGMNGGDNAVNTAFGASEGSESCHMFAHCCHNFAG